LRTPGYLHQKDPASPFLIEKRWEMKIEYSEQEMLMAYRNKKEEAEQKKKHEQAIKARPMDGSFWSNVWNLNCMHALEKLSGTRHVGEETYHFTENATGTWNIIVNGKGSACWIDRDGHIGSADGGGPTIAQWLNWFHKDYAKVVEIIAEVFPECRDSQISLI